MDPNAEYVVITNDGKEHEAKILALDPLSDLAIIQIHSENKYSPLKFVNDS
jgi:S1-C subfamily serine protease